MSVLLSSEGCKSWRVSCLVKLLHGMTRQANSPPAPPSKAVPSTLPYLNRRSSFQAAVSSSAM